MIENVQIRATKLVDGLGSLEYPERLKKLNLLTLCHRRARGAMIELWKHFNVYSRETMSGTFEPRERSTRAHDRLILEHIPKDGVCGLQSNSFYYRHVRTWNNLPAEVVNTVTINTFKNNLDKFWNDEPSKYDHQANHTERFEEDM